MFCTSCGSKLADGARFCTSCGRATSVPPVGSPLERVQRFCRHPLWIVLGVLASIFALLAGTASLIALIQADMDTALGSWLAVWSVIGHVASIVLLAVGVWMIVSGGYNNLSHAGIGTRLIHIGGSIGGSIMILMMILYVIDMLWNLLMQSEHMSFTVLERQKEIYVQLLIITMVVTIVAMNLYFVVAGLASSFGKNIRLLQRDDGSGWLRVHGFGTAIFLFVIAGICLFTTLLAGDEVENEVLVLLIMLVVTHVITGILALMHHNLMRQLDRELLEKEIPKPIE